MIEGGMARGEISPDNYCDDWVWVPLSKKTKPLPTKRIGIKNKFIHRCMKVNFPNPFN